MSGVLCAPAAGAVRAARFVRWASRTPRLPRATEGDEEDEADRPIQFSSSRAHPARWSVQHSLGQGQQRPWWRVLPFSLTLMALVVWCFLRQETGTDRWLRRVLGEEAAEPADGAREPGAAAGERARS
ncbi:ubiquinol-cytochrome c reductase complex assembly factor 4 [Vulpes vulpes]|uniref:Ubiquinol-cytochrome c reductase complex assembly factor 4 n=1 Tax=Vulpes vulpes TaxID=9627 RepID=A0A3Q7R590_VULVU|nr:protein CCSMST1 [Vulpes vulpes]XP_041606082.1 protein CCSMST1 [Vulpes lagopus]